MVETTIGERMELLVEVLGPLRLVVQGTERRVGGRRERAVLGLLVAARPGHVSPDRVVDELWGEDAPASALGSVQVAVSRLRTALRAEGSVGGTSGILLAPGGYTITGVTVDAEAMSRTLERVADLPPATVVQSVEEVAARWRGQPYADVAELPTLAAEAARLTEERLLLEEARAEALLALGRPDRAQALLAGLVEDHPYRERLWRQLALALYRCDRQAESLAVLRRLQTALVDELGVDPSLTTRSLEQAVLVHDRSLDLVAEPGVPSTVGSSAAQGLVVGAPYVSQASLVGRNDVTEDLHGRVDRLTAGRGGVLLLTGEAGIGKSALVRELVDYARHARVVALVGQCHEAEVAPAYWPWLGVLRALVGDDPPPVVAALLGATTGFDAPVVDASSSALRVFEAVASVLGGAGPLLVVLEDLHWADVSSLRLLAYAVEALASAPVAFVLTARDTESRQHPALAASLAALARLGADRCRVRPLSISAISDLVRPVVPGADEQLVQVIAERTDGNPFFALQLVRLLAARDEATAAAARALQVPDGVADVLRLRLLRLPAEAREVVAAASVGGRVFHADVLEDALGRPALDDLDQAVAAGVLEDGDRPGRYRFVHALARETAYADQPSGRRARLHGAFGDALAGRLEHAPDLVALVAHHYAQAAGHLPHLLPTAVDFQSRAARDAERRGAYDEALVAWTEAVELEGRMSRRDADRRHRLLLALATARQRTGDMAGMQEALAAAIDEARERGDWTAVAQAATSFRSSGVWYWREMGYEDSHTVAALQEALQHVDDPSLRARLWANLGMEHYGVWRSVEANECGERSLELARASGDPDTLLVCLSARAIVLWMPGRAADHADAAREMLALRLGPEEEITARFHLAVALHHLNRAPEADEVIARAFALAAELRHTNCDVPLAWWRWMRAAETASPHALELGEQVLALHRRTTMMSLHEGTALVVLDSLPLDAAVPADLVSFGRGHPQYGVRATIGYALAVRGQVEEGLELVGPLPPPEQYDYASHCASCLHAEVLALAGETEQLAQILPRIAPFAEETATFGSVVSCGSTAYFVGRALAALGRSDEARELLRRAVSNNVEAGATRFVAASQAALDALDLGS